MVRRVASPTVPSWPAWSITWPPRPGIRQFLDIGTGLPTADNTHQVAQQAAPESRVMYVDNDPIVLAHARALLTSSPEGATDYIEADARDTGSRSCTAGGADPGLQPAGRGHAARHPAVHRGRGRPVRSIISAAHGRGPRPGSYLAVSQVASDIEPEQMAEAAKRYNRLAHETQCHRSHAEVAGFFDGLELIEPGVVAVQEWRPGSEIEARTRSAMWGGAGRKR